MDKISITKNGFKYVYLVVFFALLSGLFYPLINGTSIHLVIFGVLVLFLGLAGGISLYKSITSENKNKLFLGIGFSLIIISLLLILRVGGGI